jgi:hypothetical protein
VGPIDCLSGPCVRKNCGSACETCDTVDGSCYSGFCSIFGACKPSMGSCPGQLPEPDPMTLGCGAFDAVGLGDCSIVFGLVWDGSKCVTIVGCICQGSDCQQFLDGPACAAFTFGCSVDGSADAPDDANGK